jgi:hypothetical protein
VLQAFDPLAPNVPTAISFDATMPAFDVSYTTPNALIVSGAGTYKIYYNLLVASGTAILLTCAIRLNGVNIPGAVLVHSLTANQENELTGTVIATLAAGDVLDMAISSSAGATVTLGVGVNASLVLTRLS